jgi:hypothetical protein
MRIDFAFGMMLGTLCLGMQHWDEGPLAIARAIAAGNKSAGAQPKCTDQ